MLLTNRNKNVLFTLFSSTFNAIPEVT
jgi:hypothetical protein